MKVYGNDIFIDMISDPPFVDSFFSHITDTILQVSKFVQKRQRESGFDIDLLSMSNCVMNLIAPTMYQRFVLPHDLVLSKQYQRFGIHTCNWDITPYINSLKHIKKMGYLDMGICSDMEKVRECYPNARRAVFISPTDLECKSIDELKSNVIKIKNSLAPCDIVMADVDSTTSDKKVVGFLNMVKEVNDNTAN